MLTIWKFGKFAKLPAKFSRGFCLHNASLGSIGIKCATKLWHGCKAAQQTRTISDASLAACEIKSAVSCLAIVVLHSTCVSALLRS